MRFWNIIPNATDFRCGLYAFISITSFGPVPILALFTAATQRRRARMLAQIHIVIVYFTLVHTITTASLRYRLPIAPLVIVVTAEAVAAAIEKVQLAASRPRDYPLARFVVEDGAANR